MKIITEMDFPQDSSDMASSSSSSMGFPQNLTDVASSSSGSMGVPDYHTCAHSRVFRGRCLVCGTKLDRSHGLPFKYIDRDLWLSHKEIAQQRKVQSDKLLNERKLVLLLDLDHTLLHTSAMTRNQKTQEELNSFPDLYSLEPFSGMTKLRPYVHEFLKEASSLFELYIYTMGERHYAMRMAQFLDPENVYFNSRIIAYEDYREDEKTLDLVLKKESMILILDDTKKVWKKHTLNLIHVKKYSYFDSHERSTVSLSSLNTDEDERTGELATILKKLQLIHRLFFNPKSEDDLADRDVKYILVRLTKLQGCNIFFNHIFPPNFDPENSRLWMMAEELGAICSKELCASVTHVVTHLDTRAKESQKGKKFWVNPRWLRACYHALGREAEEEFPIPVPKPKVKDKKLRR
jgi:RNA polymerase II C-terminal domain phosphatase-like 3/4